MKSYDLWLTEGADIGLDGPFLCEPCAHDKHDQHIPDECECDCPPDDAIWNANIRRWFEKGGKDS
jgi:hypothetical protein